MTGLATEFKSYYERKIYVGCPDPPDIDLTSLNAIVYIQMHVENIGWIGENVFYYPIPTIHNPS